MTSFAFIFGVVPLMIASGAGAEMRRSLGIAVFSGMFGVTLFGIFLTPVFFYVIIGLGESRLFASAASRWLVSCFAGRPRWGWPAASCWGSSASCCFPGRPWSALRRRARGAGDSGDSSENQAQGRRIRSRDSPARPLNPMEDRRHDPLLCRSSDLLHGHLRGFRAGGRSGRVHAARGPVPGGHAAHRAGDGPLSGRQRPDRARHRGGADRGAGQRRRGHGLHVVALAPTTAPTT